MDPTPATPAATKTRRPTETPGGPTRTRRPTETPGGPTKTPAPTATLGPPQVLYVRANGSDANSGTAPDQALKTIVQAAKLLRPGTTVYVGPGRYTGRVAITGVTGAATAPIALLADPTGVQTGDRAGVVTLDAGGDAVALIVTKSPYVTADGFLITGAKPRVTPEPVTATAVQIRSGSDHATISNCVIANGATADGIRIDGSDAALLFNNLIFANDRGITITGAASDARVINNTIVSNERTGILLAQKSGAAPTDATVTNNIVQENGNLVAISIGEGPPSSLSGYAGDYNLVFEPDAADQTTAYRPSTIRGDQDINADALFVNLPQGDVHLATGSPAIDQGSDRIGDALVSALLQRSTAESGGKDQRPVDIGYHYPRP
jgi:parallel beta-helix repeat protein